MYRARAFFKCVSFCCVVCGADREGLIPIHSQTDRGEVPGGEGTVVRREEGGFVCLLSQLWAEHIPCISSFNPTL